MSISRDEFNVLELFTYSNGAPTQREIALKVNASLGKVNKTVKELTEKGYIDKDGLTKLGLEILEPFKVKRAVFIAAGFSQRLAPITLNTPKPLIRVNGKRIIDSLLDAVVNLGIEEIYIVRGYLPEQFDQLLYKYPTVKFLENPLYNESNNISSAVCARYLLKNCYVFESDLILHNPKILKKYHYSSNFLAIPKERTDDWCFNVENGVIKSEKIGGYNCHQMVGISYWDENSGNKLANHLEEAFNSPGGKEYFWEQVPLTVYKDSYCVEVKECNEFDIVEIDTFNELKHIDKIYNI